LFGFTGNVYAQDNRSLVSIDVVPATATMAVGDQIQFLAVGDDGQGGTVVLTDPQWSISGGATLIPIADTCIVRADETGGYTLTCREGGTSIEDNAQIEITSNLAKIEVHPANIMLNVGNIQHFTATGKDQYGNIIPLTDPQWSTSGGGTLTPSGSTCTYTATTTGSYTITCQEDGTQGTANIHTTGTPVETSTGSGTAYFATDAGTLENLAAVDESTLPEEGKPALVFPHGFFSFDITDLTPCTHQKVVVTITLPSAVPGGTEYWKYHASEGGWIRIPMGSDDGDAVITITLEDGGLGDDDGECNGVIVDSGGPGVGAPKPRLTKSAPTSVAPSGNITYTINYANVGLVALTDVTITENYPGGVTFISADPAPDAGTNDKWTIGTLSAGVSGQIIIKVKAPDSRDLSFTETGSVTGEGFVMVSKDQSTEQKQYTLKNVVTLSCAELPPISAYATTNVTIAPEIEVNKTASLTGSCPGSDPLAVNISDTITYCFNVSNTGDVNLTGVMVIDDIYGSVTLGTTTLAPGESTEGTLTHVVMESDAPSVTDTATATGTPPVGAEVTDIDDCTIDVAIALGIEVVKTASLTGTG
jgi:uncharacterized repeat protein (TIGR01451 family)